MSYQEIFNQSGANEALNRISQQLQDYQSRTGQSVELAGNFLGSTLVNYGTGVLYDAISRNSSLDILIAQQIIWLGNAVDNADVDFSSNPALNYDMSEWSRLGFEVLGQNAGKIAAGALITAIMFSIPGINILFFSGAVLSVYGLSLPLLAWGIGTLLDWGLKYGPGELGQDLGILVFDKIISPLIAFLRDPLTLDLDGDGIELVALNNADGSPNSTTYFDLDGNGFAERTGWVSPDDGLLVRDINRNGTVDSVAELFGNSTQDGFAVLETLDTNGDGKITAEDEVFGELRVWRDLNQDGVSQANELFTLTELGIAEISVEATDVTGTNQGHDLGLTALFTRNDGTTGEATSIYFQTDGQDSVPDETGFTPSAAARLLPLNDNLQRQTHLVA